MTFVILLTLWTAFIAYLFSLVERVLRKTPLGDGFVGYFMVGFYCIVGWMIVAMVLRSLAPDPGFRLMVMALPLLPLAGGVVLSFCRSRARRTVEDGGKTGS